MKKLLLLITLIVVQFPGYALGEALLPYDIQSVLITKILMYDNNLTKNIKNNILTIGIVYRNDERSKMVLKSMSDEFAKLKAKGIKIKNSDFDYAAIVLDGSLTEQLKAKNISALYITDGSMDISAVVNAAQNLKIMTIVGDNADQCVANGVSVGLKNENEKPSILVNLQSAMREGRDFSAQFLALVKIVKN